MRQQKFICPRCLNEDQSYFYRGSKGWYCRKCISFGRALIEEAQEAVSLSAIQNHSEEYTLQYPLTEKQKEIGIAAAMMIDESDVLIQAVCGAGKTEMVVPLIAKCLKEKKKICFAIARRQVVLELQERLSSYFPYAHVVAVCGGHTAETDGDLIICTTHQLYRYYHAFHVLILDEPDAFPFRGNTVLHGIAKTSCIGHCLYLTATPDGELLRRVKEGDLICYQLNRRPHGHDLPVPVIYKGLFLIRLLVLLRWIRKHKNHPRMIFVPMIAQAKRFSVLFGLFEKCYECTSKTENRDETIAQFKREKAGLIVATTVLERGVTVPKADIAVWDADSFVFDQAGLEQMAGRAGRSFVDPTGDVLFLVGSRSEKVLACQRRIMEANACDA